MFVDVRDEAILHLVVLDVLLNGLKQVLVGLILMALLLPFVVVYEGFEDQKSYQHMAPS